MRHAGLGIRRETQPAGLDVALDHHVEPGFMDGHFAAQQPLDLGRIDVDADHVIADVREARARHQAHVAGAEYRHSHACSPIAILARA